MFNYIENSIYELSLIVIEGQQECYPLRCSCWQRGFFSTFEDADAFIKEHQSEWRELDVFCIYLRQKPMGMMLSDDELSAVWLYDAEGTLVDKRMCSNANMNEPFPWRTYEQERFHPGDIVEVLQNDEVFLAYIPGKRMTAEDIKHHNDFVEGKFGDASDDIYTVLTSDSYDSHQHIDSLHVFKPHLEIIDSIRSELMDMYNRNLQNDYSDEIKTQTKLVDVDVVKKGYHDPDWAFQEE